MLNRDHLRKILRFKLYNILDILDLCIEISEYIRKSRYFGIVEFARAF